MCLQLLMELQKVALRADEDVGPVRQTLSTFAGQLSNVVDKQLQVSSHMRARACVNGETCEFGFDEFFKMGPLCDDCSY